MVGDRGPDELVVDGAFKLALAAGQTVRPVENPVREGEPPVECIQRVACGGLLGDLEGGLVGEAGVLEPVGPQDFVELEVVQLVVVSDLLLQLFDLFQFEGSRGVRIVKVGLVEAPEVEVPGPDHHVRLAELQLLVNLVNLLGAGDGLGLLPAAGKVAVDECHRAVSYGNFDGQGDLEGDAVGPKIDAVGLPQLDREVLLDIQVPEHEGRGAQPLVRGDKLEPLEHRVRLDEILPADKLKIKGMGTALVSV